MLHLKLMLVKSPRALSENQILQAVLVDIINIPWSLARQHKSGSQRYHQPLAGRFQLEISLLVSFKPVTRDFTLVVNMLTSYICMSC
jgi:hypothetical protein